MPPMSVMTMAARMLPTNRVLRAGEIMA